MNTFISLFRSEKLLLKLSLSLRKNIGYHSDTLFNSVLYSLIKLDLINNVDDLQSYGVELLELTKKIDYNLGVLFEPIIYSLIDVGLIKNANDLKIKGLETLNLLRVLAISKIDHLSSEDLPNLLRLLKEKGDIQKYWKGIVFSIIKSKNPDLVVVFKHDLPFFIKEGLVQNSKDLVRYVLGSGILYKGLFKELSFRKKKIDYLYNKYLPHLISLLEEQGGIGKYWLDIVSIGKAAEHNFEVLFMEVLPFFIRQGLVKNEDDLKKYRAELIGLAKKSGNSFSYLFRNILSYFIKRGLIKNKDDLRGYGAELLGLKDRLKYSASYLYIHLFPSIIKANLIKNIDDLKSYDEELISLYEKARANARHLFQSGLSFFIEAGFINDLDGLKTYGCKLIELYKKGGIISSCLIEYVVPPLVRLRLIQNEDDLKNYGDKLLALTKRLDPDFRNLFVRNLFLYFNTILSS
jgi:hypothetical protein